MSFTDLLDSTAYGDTNSGTATMDIPVTNLTDVTEGDLVVIFWTANVASLTATIDDDGAGNSYYDNITPRSGATLSLGYFWCRAKGNNFGTRIRVTLSGTASRKSATLVAFSCSNKNPQWVGSGGASSDSVSPVDIPTPTAVSGISPSWPATDCLSVCGWGWRGGAVASGFAGVTAGYTIAANQGASGGTTSRVETNVAYDVNLGSATPAGATATYTSISLAHAQMLVFSDEPTGSPAVRQASMMPYGSGNLAFSARCGQCVAGNILLLAIAVNQNGGAVTITPPAGFTEQVAKDQAGDVDLRYYTMTAAGGETQLSGTLSASTGRINVHLMEIDGTLFQELIDGTPSSANGTGATTGDSGTTTPTGAGRFYTGVVVVKNSVTMSEGGGFSVSPDFNEGGAASTQKLTTMVVFDDSRSTAAREQPTWVTAANYVGVGLLLMPVAAPEAWAPLAVQDAIPPARGGGGGSRVTAMWPGAAPAAPAAWSPPPLERATPRYVGGPSMVIGAADEFIPLNALATVVAAPQERVRRRSLTFGNFADTVVAAPGAAPAPARSIDVEPLSRPPSLVASTFDERIDAYVQGVASRAQPSYRGALAVVALVASPPAAAPGVLPAMGQVSRRREAYQGAPALVVATFDERIDAYVAGALAKPREAPLGRRSTITQVFPDAAVVANTGLAQAYSSRRVAPYIGAPSTAIGAGEEPLPVTDFGLAIVTRPAPGRPLPLSLVTDVFFSPAAPAVVDPAQLVVASRRLPQPPPMPSRVIAAYRDTTGCTTLYPDTPLLPGDPLFPDMCAPVVMVQSALSSRVVLYRPPASLIRPVYFSPVLTAASWAQVTQSRVLIGERAHSFVVTPDFTSDAYVPVASSAKSLEQLARESLTIFPRHQFIPVTNAYVEPARSREVPFYRGPLARFFAALEPAAADEIVNSGGGGEWVIWGKPDFPGNRPDAWPRFPRPGFKRPSRYEKRGY